MPLRLAPDSERQLSGWIREPLSVAVHPFPDRDALADLEHRVLTQLDLNLEGMQVTPLRKALTGLRGLASGLGIATSRAINAQAAPDPFRMNDLQNSEKPSPGRWG